MVQVKGWQSGLLLFVTLGIIAVAGCTTVASVKAGDTVKVEYTLTLDDGTVFDTSVGKDPLQFTLGTNAVISGFEKAVLGMKVGETKEVKILPAEGYGNYDASLVAEYDRSQLPDGVTPQIGMKLTAQRTDGSMVTVTITSFTDNKVTIDANSPLAGKNLNFKIKLIEIVAPTKTTTAKGS